MAVDLDNAKHKGVRLFVDLADLVVENPMEVVAGGAGFVNDSGLVDLDLTSARVFYRTLTGNVTEFTFSNVPSSDAYGASWRVVLRVDANGPYTFATTTPVTFVDGSSWDDLDLTANAENELVFWRSGTGTKGAFVDTGTLALEPYVFNFKTTDSLSVPITRTEVIDVANATVLGAGTVVYKRDATVITTATTFTAGTHAEFVVEAEAGQRISVPRYVA